MLKGLYCRIENVVNMCTVMQHDTVNVPDYMTMEKLGLVLSNLTRVSRVTLAPAATTI